MLEVFIMIDIHFFSGLAIVTELGKYCKLSNSHSLSFYRTVLQALSIQPHME